MIDCSKAFKPLIVLHLLGFILTMVLYILFYLSIPAEISQYALAQNTLSQISVVGLLVLNIGLLIGFFAYWISLIGLWFYKKWARQLYLVTNILAYLLYIPKAVYILDNFSLLPMLLYCVMSGVFLAMLYLTPLAERFNIQPQPLKT